MNNEPTENLTKSGSSKWLWGVLIIFILIIVSLVFYILMPKEPSNEFSGIWYTPEDFFGLERMWIVEEPDELLSIDSGRNGTFFYYCHYTLDNGLLSNSAYKIEEKDREVNFGDFYTTSSKYQISVEGDKLVVDLTPYLSNYDEHTRIVNPVVTFERVNLPKEEAIEEYFSD